MKWTAALATLLAAALAVRAAAAAAACDAEGWEPLAPEVRWWGPRRLRTAGGSRVPTTPPPWPAAPQEIPDEVLNVTITKFESLYVPSEDNPDNGTRLIWVVPCELLDVEVQSACQQVRRPSRWAAPARPAPPASPPPLRALPAN